MLPEDANAGAMAPTVHLMLNLGLLFLASQAAGRVASFIRLPRVTGYLLAGVLLGPELLGVFSRTLVEDELGLVTEIALAVIAFSIGGSLKISRLRRLGNAIVWITLLQALGAFAIVAVATALLLPWFPEEFQSSGGLRALLPPALVLAAVATATAPAAVMAIVHECRARGPVTTVLLGIVALDDALCLFLFAIALNLAQVFAAGDGLAWTALTLQPLGEIATALGLGAGVGLAMIFPIRLFHDPDTLLGVVLGVVLLTAGAGLSIGVSPLLATMTLGFVAVNLFEQHEETFLPVESIEEPLFGLFFALAGAHLNFSVGGWALVLALALTLTRFAGKLLGVRAGARLSRAPAEVRNYVGLGLLPTAGVAIGLVLEARNRLPDHPLWSLVVDGVLASVIINELIAPVFVRAALTRSGEARRRRPKRFSRREATADAGRS